MRCKRPVRSVHARVHIMGDLFMNGQIEEDCSPAFMDNEVIVQLR